MKQKKLTIRYIDVLQGDFDKTIEEITTTFQAEAKKDKNDFIVTFIGTEKEINKDTEYSYVQKLDHIFISNNMHKNEVETTIDDLENMNE